MSAPKPAAKPRRPRGAAHRAGQPTAAAADLSEEALRLAASIEREVAAGHADALTPEAVQALMAAVCRSYSAQVEAGKSFALLAPRSSPNSTDVMTAASGLLRAANLAVFELGMWQSWTGR
ncbi:MAG TPA: hypothetical protein VHA77_03940 [Xanthobacteraceae bacterium]|jgi:hypothetical protein|nr:hypothetical protein [Xanthobacteraceae bacterium]